MQHDYQSSPDILSTVFLRADNEQRLPSWVAIASHRLFSILLFFCTKFAPPAASFTAGMAEKNNGSSSGYRLVQSVHIGALGEGFLFLFAVQENT